MSHKDKLLNLQNNIQVNAMLCVKEVYFNFYLETIQHSSKKYGENHDSAYQKRENTIFIGLSTGFHYNISKNVHCLAWQV